MPRAMRFREAMDIFSILKLHRASKETIISSMPPSLRNISFGVDFAHLGHLKHTNRAGQPICDWRDRGNDSTPFELDDSQKQEMGSNGFFEITMGKSQCVMASHGVGPWYELTPNDSCVTWEGPQESDEVFLSEGCNLVLIRREEESESAPQRRTVRYTPGVLTNTGETDSISKAVAKLHILKEHLPSLEYTDADFRSETRRMDIERKYGELSLQQLVVLVVFAGRHHEYWDTPLQ
ncbi:hypothetical protein V2G26_007395 [Clonostachys chloroleuca]